MRDLWISLVFVVLLAAGVTAPFVAGLGYVWIDTFFPQRLADEMIGRFPISLIMGALTFFSYLALDRRAPPRISWILVLTLFMAAWVTLTSTWSVAPDEAWPKWDWAFKAVLFSAFLPFLFRSRVQIEAFLLVEVFSMTGHIIPWGVKAALGGAGYNRSLGLMPVNTIPLSESSTTAAFAIMLVPLILVFRQHSLLFPNPTFRKWVFGFLAAAMLAGALGTFARTAIVGFAVIAIGLWIRSRRKVAFTAVIIVAVGGLAAIASDSWTQRMSTTQDFDKEASAAARIKVWEWTIDYTLQHPQGGGFNSFVIDRIELEQPEGGETVRFGVAFHNVYFEMLGEHGWIGLACFLLLMVLSLQAFQGVIRRTRHHPELAWCNDLARALQISLLAMMACGSFIGVAFQPTLWNLFGSAVCLREYVRRTEATRAAPRRIPRSSVRTGAPGLAMLP